MSNILSLSNDISLTKNTLIRTASSVGGYATSVRGGPSLFSIQANLPVLSEAQHLMVQEELINDFGDGITFKTNAAIPAKALLTPWRGSDLTGASVNTTNSTGSVVALTGVPADSFVKAGDFIQFTNQTKVFQIKTDATASGTNLTFNLNQSVITPLLVGTTWLTGNNVRFKLQIASRPVVTAIPQGANSNLYSYNEFNFNEVL